MKNADIPALLDKYKTGTITPEELDVLEDWYLNWQPEQTEITDEELQALKDEVWQSLYIPQGKNTRIRLWPGMAAAASLLLLIAATAYFFYPTSKMSMSAQVTTHHIKNDAAPGGNKALLTLANGQQVVLSDAADGKIAEQGATTINKTKNGQLIYQSQDNLSSNAFVPTIYNTLTTPRGGQYHIVLSDGTQVWLNAASTLTYPVSFTNGERKVVAQGEVYFEVARNEKKPFKVSLGNQEITVLGTSFNVQGYADDTCISTTLLTGSIRIYNVTTGQSGLLRPGQEARLGKKPAQLSIRNVNTENAVSWKEGYFVFDNEDIQSIMKTMSRWYDVDVEYKNYNNQDRYGGTFSRSSNMSDILRNLEQVGHVHFETQSDKIIVTN